METLIRRYTFRLYPNAGQQAALDNLRVMSCRLYNALVEQRRDAWDRRRISLTKFDQQREMTRLANDPDCPEWKVFPSAIRERVGERVDQAFRKYFDNVKAWRRGQWRKPFPPRPPHFQKSAEFSGFGLREMPKGWRWLDGRKVRIQGVGDIRIRGRFPASPDHIRTADVVFRDGRWEISIVVKFEVSGRMHRPARPFSNGKVPNSLSQTMRAVSIRCSDPAFAGELQGRIAALQVRACCSDPAFAGKMQAPDRSRPPARGRKNRNRRWRNRIARRDHALHEFTSWLAAHGGDIELTIPPLRDATRTGRGDAREHGALVGLKARANRHTLDLAIGKLREMLEYKVAAHGNTLTVIEDASHPAMVPELAASTAKLARKVQRTARRTPSSKLEATRCSTSPLPSPSSVQRRCWLKPAIAPASSSTAPMAAC